MCVDKNNDNSDEINNLDQIQFFFKFFNTNTIHTSMYIICEGFFRN